MRHTRKRRERRERRERRAAEKGRFKRRDLHTHQQEERKETEKEVCDTRETLSTHHNTRHTIHDRERGMRHTRNSTTQTCGP